MPAARAPNTVTQIPVGMMKLGTIPQRIAQTPVGMIVLGTILPRRCPNPSATPLPQALRMLWIHEVSLVALVALATHVACCVLVCEMQITYRTTRSPPFVGGGWGERVPCLGGTLNPKREVAGWVGGCKPGRSAQVYGETPKVATPYTCTTP